MELRLVVLSIACFACLIPSAVSINLLAAKAVASQAAGDIAAIGAKTLEAKKNAIVKAANEIAAIAAQGATQKGEAIKTAATSMAGAMINGALSIGATIAKAGLNMIAAKFTHPTVVYEPSIVIKPPVVQDAIIEEKIVEKPVVVEYDQEIKLPVQSRPISSVSVDVSPDFFDLPAPPQLPSVWTTVEEVAPAFEFVGHDNSPYVYEIVQTPQVQYGPLIESFQFIK
ncbi:uncharacterized protein LOC110370627 [Helicoverpa armigera]|uniref:uncharacterized protein LOC110370627 n=1 Tax=Helicoverpa armigera TaxID=29058 RepID=UPI00308338E1